MQNFAAELRKLSKKYTLTELESKDFYKKYCSVCEYQKTVEHDIEGRWTICTHSSFDDSPYTWACALHHCPFVSEGRKEAYILLAKKREERK